MENMEMKKIFGALAAILVGVSVASCDNDARVVSQNISTAADNFEINRRIVFYNGITNEYILTVEGLCSQQHDTGKFTVTCKTGPGTYKKHFLGLSNNVTYFSEQMEASSVSKYFYKVTFKPSVIIPDIQVK
jgi:hypothetical protein